MHRFLRLSLFLLLFSSQSAYTQSKKTGTWGLFTVVLPSNTDHRWGGYFESQARTDELFFGKLFYHEFKGGLSYAIDNNYVALIGTGRYTTYDYLDFDKGPTITENRVWEQMTFTQYLSRIKIEHRYRVEQRWVNQAYRNRFRYRLNLVVPLNEKKMKAGTAFVSAFNEIFLNNKQPNFERNRVSTSLGYQFSKSITAQAGWVYQYNNALAGTNAKNNLIINFTYQIQRKKPGAHEELPTLKD
ncbi:DUF2490 domain-containing protein [Pedobacter sp. MC2016-14]|uniref:DUF2490 domain-containing protein n=1 Tax=Pedobacter sp. MC2016-14 TaxID=2897327 RepID=UPI001E420898|nr:DUF2490 domain-containing protein [Pedobacter sp. MC2016-14]MCD0488808.1 DUF2490 domain-containing protein [Pedobacter sp. MC2016-14]